MVDFPVSDERPAHEGMEALGHTDEELLHLGVLGRLVRLRDRKEPLVQLLHLAK